MRGGQLENCNSIRRSMFVRITNASKLFYVSNVKSESDESKKQEENQS